MDVMTTGTMYMGTISGAALHGLVVSTTNQWDSGMGVLLLVAASCYAWTKENHHDEYSGVSTVTSSLSVLVSVVLVVVSEVMLFISILWSVVLCLVAHSIYHSSIPYTAPGYIH